MNAQREKEILLAQLIAARAQIDATIAVLVPDECEHPKEAVEDLSTFGSEGPYRCGLCGAESAKPFQVEE